MPLTQEDPTDFYGLQWKRNLSEDQIKDIVPADVRKTNITSAIQAALRTYFTEKILFPRLMLDGFINK